MNKCSFLVFGLLYALAICVSFKWNKIDCLSDKVSTPNIGHQSSTDGFMNMAWKLFDNSMDHRLGGMRIAPDGIITRMNNDYNKNIFPEEVTLQAATFGKTIFVAFFGCKNGPTSDSQPVTPRDCARVYLMESNKEGQTWSDPQKISPDNEFIAPDSPLSMVLQKNTNKMFLFYATRKEGTSTSNIVVIGKNPGEKVFTKLATLPTMERLISFTAGETYDDDTGKFYLHIFFTNNKDLYYTRSSDEGKTWEDAYLVKTGISPARYNFAAIDSRAESQALYVQYRMKSSGDVYITKSKDHGKTFKTPIKIGVSPAPSKDAIGICGSDDMEEAIVLSGHAGAHADEGYIGYMLKDKSSFINLPYPFTKTSDRATANLMINCAYRRTHQFYITFAVLGGTGRESICYAHGTLDLVD